MNVCTCLTENIPISKKASRYLQNSIKGNTVLIHLGDKEKKYKNKNRQNDLMKISHRECF